MEGWRDGEDGEHRKEAEYVIYVLWWKERGSAESRGYRGYDYGCSKDSLWTGGAGSKVPDGLRRKAAGRDDDETDRGDGGGDGGRKGAGGGGAGGSVYSVATQIPAEKHRLKFKDALGRKFNFPLELVQTWPKMKGLITQAFEHVEPLGLMVAEDYFDMIGPDGAIISPQVWQTVIKPDWIITQHMWRIKAPPAPEVEEVSLPPPCGCYGIPSAEEVVALASCTQMDLD